MIVSFSTGSAAADDAIGWAIVLGVWLALVTRELVRLFAAKRGA